jgi:hypothetical protein
MSRVIAAQKHFAKSQLGSQSTSTAPSLEISSRKIEDACRKVHRECLALVTEQIRAEVEPGISSSEDMALLLSCAQIAQSAATLTRTDSLQLPLILSACADVCEACLRHPFSSLRPEVYLNMELACRECLSVVS